MPNSTPVIDYEGSQYKTDFWVNQGREYEDKVERLVLERLLPPQGRRIIEIGAGFGRLANLYTGYEQVVLFDYSRSLLAEAVRQWGDDPRFVFVAGNVYELPFAEHTIDSLVMVRVMHHLANVPSALQELHRVTHSNSVSVIEFASKRNLKSILRWVFSNQDWSPFDQDPYEFVELNFDFHPQWMADQFSIGGFEVDRRLGVSHFRLALLKQLVSSRLLAQLDNAISNLGGIYPLSPSVFVKMKDAGKNRGERKVEAVSDLTRLFRCPKCKTESIKIDEDKAICTQCIATHYKKGGIWDFKESA